MKILLMVCPSCKKLFDWHENAKTGKAEIPIEGDCGVCTNCKEWWELKNGRFVYYTPFPEDLLILKQSGRKV